MINTGKDLEDYVMTILGGLLPPDFTISQRVKKYNEKGDQINEFDIIVEGKIFTFTFKWLIECRDRPSQGPSPRSWIENLIARRQLNKFDKVTAVSTSGFSSGAIELAKIERIGIDQVKSFEPDNLLDWFKNNQLLYIRLIFAVKYVALFTLFPNDEDNKKLSASLRDVTVHSEILSYKSNTKKISLKFACDDALRQSQEIKKLVDEDLNLIANKLRFDVDYSNPEFQYYLHLENKDIVIRKIVFIGDLNLEKVSVPISKVKQYVSEEDKYVIAESAYFNIHVDDEDFGLAFHKVRNQDQIKIFTTKS